MASIKQSKVLDWLLEPSQPSVRYYTLVDLLDRASDDPDVRDAYSAIPTRGWAYEILAEQKPEGHWESPDDLYRPKYNATIWKLIVLSDLGMTSSDERVRKSCELFLKSYPRSDGGFDVPGSKWPGSELCLTGNLARTLLRCGYGEDPRVQRAFEWLVNNQREDGGWHCLENSKKGTLDCWEGLSAYSYLPREKWTKSIKNSVERGVGFYLKRQLFKEGKQRYLPWFNFHYPVHYYYDLLVGLDTITALGYGDDKRLRRPLEIMKKKQRHDGTWIINAAHPNLGRGAGYRFKVRPKPFTLEQSGKPSKWITLTALKVLKRIGESSAS